MPVLAERGPGKCDGLFAAVFSPASEGLICRKISVHSGGSVLKFEGGSPVFETV